MHGVPQSGFARLIFRMKSRTHVTLPAFQAWAVYFSNTGGIPADAWNDRIRLDDNERKTQAGPQVQQFHGQGRSRRRARRTGVT